MTTVTAPDVQARATVGASFIEPDPSDEALVAAIASMLRGRGCTSGTSAELSESAEKLAREISQVLLSRFHITERKRK